jgi:hypothetical protein
MRAAFSWLAAIKMKAHPKLNSTLCYEQLFIPRDFQLEKSLCSDNLIKAPVLIACSISLPHFLRGSPTQLEQASN